MITLASCVVPRRIKKAYIGCYDGISTGINTLLDLSGCFAVNSPVLLRDEYPGIVYRVVNFYDDGVVVCTAATTIPSEDFHKRMKHKYHQLNSDTLDLDYYKYYREGRGMYRWGLYKLHGDTVIAQFIDRPYPPEKYFSHLVKYKVIDRHTIQEVFPSGDDVFYADTASKIYHFIPIEKIPSSDCWLKDEKWFWCNRDDWKEYKRQKTVNPL
ncbi:MAG: hypothetical protein LBV74_04365 [Tannerella sp.]|nr:hypothetical protein [Tannerella sp.]